VLVSLERKVQHLSGLVTLLIDQLIAYREQSRECHLHNLVKVRPVIPVCILEPVCPAYRQQALQACKHRPGIVRVEQLGRVVEEGGPLVGEVIVQDALQYRDELLSDQGGRLCEYG
jgi:hypothetical protein